MDSRVFISHSSADRSAADKVRGALESNGIRCWIAPRNLVPGTDWGEAIVKALDECRVMVLIFSAAANDSPRSGGKCSAQFEADAAVVPLRIERVEPVKGLQYYLNSVHWLDASPPLERCLGEVVEIVRGHLTGAGERATPRLPPRRPWRHWPRRHWPRLRRARLARGPSAAMAYATPMPPRNRWRLAFLVLGFAILAIAVGGGFVGFWTRGLTPVGSPPRRWPPRGRPRHCLRRRCRTNRAPSPMRPKAAGRLRRS